MNRMASWFAHNPVAANLMMLLFVFGGLAALPSIHLEEFPEIEMDMVQVQVEYLGAAPEESEQGVCLRIEEAVEGTPDVKEIRSRAVEGACIVFVEMKSEADRQVVYDDVKNRVDAISTFPVETEKPVVRLLQTRSGVMHLAISGDLDERSLRELGQQIRDDIAGMEGVSQVALEMARNYEISIEVSEETLRRHSITFSQVAEAVRRWSLDLPGGTVKAAGGEILLRTKGQAYWGDEFEDVVVLTRTDGTALTLGEIANIRDGFEDIDLLARFNGRPAVIVKVQRFGDEDILAIAEQVMVYLAELRTRLPDSVSVEPYKIEADDLRERLSLVGGNAIGGLFMVLTVLALFLRFRVAIWVAAGVPIALLGALIWFPFLDLSLSTMSLVACLLVIGILVDDAIVVGESVYRHEQQGEDPLEAAVNGTRAVYVPVLFGVATTIAAFTPLAMLPGRMGAFLGVLGTTAIVCLVFSLIEALLILPAHLAHRSRSGERGEFKRGFKAWQRRLSSGLQELGRNGYGRLLGTAVEWRYATLAIAFGLILLTVAVVQAGYLRYQFFPPIVGDTARAHLIMPPGTPRAVTEQAVNQLEAGAEEVRAQLGDEIFVHQLTTLGALQAEGRGPPDPRAMGGASNMASLSLVLVSGDDRDVTTEEVVALWREKTGPVADAVSLEFVSQAFGMGKAIEVELRGPNLLALQNAARAVRHHLATYPHVSDISDSFRDGKQEVKLVLRPDAQPLGLTLRDLAGQVRQAFYGEEIQRVQRGRDDVRVMLRYPEEERRSLSSLEDMRIRSADGTEVPFASVAEASLGRGHSTIQRSNRMRIVSVTGNVDRARITPEAIQAGLRGSLPGVLAAYPGVEFEFSGEQEESKESASGLVNGFAVALLVIYGLLAIPLKSYAQPMIIMSVIPFGTVGALWGHLIMGWDLVFFSTLGIVALSGVVVNASLVYVHFVNERRADGVSMRDAVLEAGVVRFRPIVLTSATTFLGLVPMMAVRSVQTAAFVPMAISLAFGVLFSAVMTLFLVPSLYVVLEDLLELSRRRGRAAAPAPPVPGLGR